MQKVRGGPLLSFSGCRIFFNPLLFKVLFIVSLAVLFTITDVGYPLVRRWSSFLQPEKLVLRPTQRGGPGRGPGFSPGGTTVFNVLTHPVRRAR